MIAGCYLRVFALMFDWFSIDLSGCDLFELFCGSGFVVYLFAYFKVVVYLLLVGC